MQQRTFMPSPFEEIVECIDVAKGLPVETWESQPPEMWRSAGLTARWVIEKALRAAIRQRQLPAPETRDLEELARISGIGLASYDLAAIASTNRDVTAREPDGGCDCDAYRDACWLARGLPSMVHTSMTIWDLATRHQPRAAAASSSRPRGFA